MSRPAEDSWDAEKGTYTLTLKQKVPDTPGQTDKKPMHIPVKAWDPGPSLFFGSGVGVSILTSILTPKKESSERERERDKGDA